MRYEDLVRIAQDRAPWRTMRANLSKTTAPDDDEAKWSHLNAVNVIYGSPLYIGSMISDEVVHCCMCLHYYCMHGRTYARI